MSVIGTRVALRLRRVDLRRGPRLVGMAIVAMLWACQLMTAVATAQPRVTGPLTLLTGGGVPVRLDGLAPDATAAAVEAAFADTPRLVLRGPPGRDRTGHRRAEVFRADGRSLQETLVAAGAARVLPGVMPDLTARLLQIEALARETGAGGWGDGRFRVHAAVPSPPVAGFAIVRGRVVSVGETRNFHYLNFDDEYWTDFSVRLKPRDVRRAPWAVEPESLVGAEVEVRGFVFASGGPMIELDGPLQLRRLD